MAETALPPVLVVFAVRIKQRAGVVEVEGLDGVEAEEAVGAGDEFERALDGGAVVACGIGVGCIQANADVGERRLERVLQTR